MTYLGVADLAKLLLLPLVFVLVGMQPATALSSPPLADRVMSLLANLPSRQVPFVERKDLRSLTVPLVSSGTLIFVRPDYLEKDTKKPKPERLVIEGNKLTMVEPGKAPQAVAIADHPDLSALVETLRATLRGDLHTLKSLYEITDQGTLQSWRLDLTPISPALRGALAGVSLSGVDAELKEIIIRQPNGDTDQLRLQ